MKIKNKTERNRSVTGNYSKSGGEPFRLLIPAHATLEISDEEFKSISKQVLELEAEEIFEVVDAPETGLSVEEIIKLVKDKVDVTLSKKDSKKDLQKKAKLLGVDLI